MAAKQEVRQAEFEVQVPHDEAGFMAEVEPQAREALGLGTDEPVSWMYLGRQRFVAYARGWDWER